MIFDDIFLKKPGRVGGNLFMKGRDGKPAPVEELFFYFFKISRRVVFPLALLVNDEIMASGRAPTALEIKILVYRALLNAQLPVMDKILFCPDELR